MHSTDARSTRASAPRHEVVVIGGGAGGATVAALLLKARPGLDLAIVEPADTHWYQPAWTLVGAGAFDVADTGRPMDRCLPGKAKRIRKRVEALLPELNQVRLADGSLLEYEYLVVAAGIQLDSRSSTRAFRTSSASGIAPAPRPARPQPRCVRKRPWSRTTCSA